MGLFQYSFANKKRDLTDALSDVRAQEPRFLRLFRPGADARQQKHEWLEDQIGGRSLTVSSIETLTITASAADVGKILVGTLLIIKDDPALFRVVAKPSATTFTVELAAANGSSTTAPEASDVMNIVSTPQREGSVNNDGEQGYKQSSVEYNYTQIFRRGVVITRSALGIDIYGNENAINLQTGFALQQLNRDMSRTALFGNRVQPTANVKGEMGGLYEFATGSGSLGVDASGAIFDDFIVNDASQAVQAEGGSPSVIVCSPGQARVLSAIMRDKIRMTQDERQRGGFVASVTNDISGASQMVIADYDMPDGHAWIGDPTGLAVSYLTNGRVTDEDTTEKGFDGIMRTILCEMTLEFKNAKQRWCLVKNLGNSQAALAAIRAGSVSI